MSAPEGDVEQGELERVQLTRRFHLWQRRRGHRSATDDVLCAWAGLVARPGARRVLDLGCGQGSVTLMLAGALPEALVVGVEAQAISHALLMRNLAESGVGDRVTGVLSDLRDSALLTGEAPFDLVTGSPPFMPLGSGPLPADPQRAAGRFEIRGGVEAYAQAAARFLAPDGLVSLLMDGAQDARCRRAFAAAGLVLQRVVSIAPKVGAPPRYIAYQAGHEAPAALETRSLAVRNAEGGWTSEMAAVRRALDLPNA